MKSLYFFISFLLVLNSFGQKQERSQPFDEPKEWVKLLQLKNGNTFFVEFTKKEGIKVKLFDINKNKIEDGKLPLKIIEDKLGYYSLRGIYEIAGNVNVFFEIFKEKTPAMIRFSIDGKTGKLVDEEKIGELEKLEMKDSYAFIYGGVDVPSIRVSKDPTSDFYAIIKCNTLATETKDRIEVIHYNPQHKVINKGNYTSPNNKYKFTNFLNAFVHKDEYVVIGTYAFNTKKSGDGQEEGAFYVSQLSHGKTSVSQKELPYKEFYKGASSFFTYNSITNKLNMIITVNSEFKGNNIIKDIVFQNINPLTLELDKPFTPDFSKINEEYKSRMNSEYDFSGSIYATHVDEIGNLIFLYQNTYYNTITNGAGSISGPPGSSFVSQTDLKDLAVVKISLENKTIDFDLLRVNTSVVGKINSFNCSDKKNGLRYVTPYFGGGYQTEQFLPLDFIVTKNAKYIFLNNIPTNLNLLDSETPKPVQKISTAVPIQYTFKNQKTKKEFLLGEPKEKKDNEFCNFGCSDYNNDNNTYVTLAIDPKTKKACVLWIKLD